MDSQQQSDAKPADGDGEPGRSDLGIQQHDDDAHQRAPHKGEASEKAKHWVEKLLQYLKHEWQQLDFHQRINLALTGAMALFTCLYVLATIVSVGVSIVTLNALKTSGQQATQQTGELIEAARIQATASLLSDLAAERFASSAEGINGGVSDAVAKLQIQAKALGRGADQTGRVAEETAKANKYVLNADRPWIGVDGLPELTDAGSPSEFTLAFHNYGKSPAIVASQPPFLIGSWSKGEIRWASANEKSRGNDWCYVEPFPSRNPTKGHYRFSMPVFQTGPSPKIHVRPTPSTVSPPRPAPQPAYLLGCIPYAGTDGEQYKLFVMYTLTYEGVNHSIHIEFRDMRSSDDE